MSDQGRFQFPSTDFYFKTQQEMNLIFHDIPEAIDNTNEIFDKITSPILTRDVLLPNFPVPQGFKDQSAYLRHLVYEGALLRYGTILPEIKERLDWELSVIDKMNFGGYFDCPGFYQGSTAHGCQCWSGKRIRRRFCSCLLPHHHQH